MNRIDMRPLPDWQAVLAAATVIATTAAVFALVALT